MAKKRNPKSKRVHDPDSGKFISEDKINSLTPFGYNDDDDDTSSGQLILLLAALLTAGFVTHTLGLLPF